MSRSFNLQAYQGCDSPAKIAAVDLMKRKGYELESDLNKEYYKNFDLRFKHIKTGKIVSIENEYRSVFHKIKLSYDTIHIPLRKKDTQSDFYFVWGPEYKDVAIIKVSDMHKYRDTPVEVHCDSWGNKEPTIYDEKFIDVPKKFAQFYTKNNNGKWKLNNPIIEK